MTTPELHQAQCSQLGFHTEQAPADLFKFSKGTGNVPMGDI